MSKIVKTTKDVYDWFEYLPENIDLWITDPPYPFDNRNGQNRFGYTTDGTDNMYKRLDWSDFKDIYEKMYQSTNDGGRAYVFCSKDGIAETIMTLRDSGWKYRNTITWYKERMGMGYHWRNSTEFIIYVTKGKPKTYVTGVENFISCKKPSAKDAIPSIGYTPYGISPKPHKIWDLIIDKGGVEGDIVSDPFAGSDPLSASLKLNPLLMEKISKAYSNTFEV